jgi:hypothetical protein
MYPLAIATFFGALLMLYTASEPTQKNEVQAKLVAEVAATNFLAYRNAVQRYLQANPSATGTIDNTALTPFFSLGYVTDSRWSNILAGGVFHVYSVSVVPPGLLTQLHSRAQDNLLIGVKDAATGQLRAWSGLNTGITLPTSIANNAIVMMGR